MKTNEFKNFMANVKELGIESSEIQSAGYAWINLTDRQLDEVKKYAIEIGYRPNKRGELKIGAYTIHMTVEEVTAVMDADIAKETAKELAKLEQKKGGKHMSNKKNNTPADNKPAQTTEQPVEVLKGEVIDTKNETEINAAIDRIASKVENIGKGYLDIVGDVARLRKYEAWKLTGHKSLYALCADKFGMARGTVANLEAVFKKYGDPETFTLTDACAGMSLRAMLAEIDAEKRAALEDKNGTPAEDGGDGEAPADNKKKGKVETLVSITWELAGDDWNTDAILEQIAKQLAKNPDAKEAFPDGACVTFTITK